MADVFTRAKRSEVMSRIRSSGNKATEIALVKLFRRHGITGWRRNQPLLGKPDFTFRRHHAVVFVDGCFWHCCPEHSTIPESNRDFWERKLLGNVVRDQLVSMTLRKQGWRVIRIWEHELVSQEFLPSRLRKILDSLR